MVVGGSAVYLMVFINDFAKGSFQFTVDEKSWKI